jgi:hypothetical protein
VVIGGVVKVPDVLFTPKVGEVQVVLLLEDHVITDVPPDANKAGVAERLTVVRIEVPELDVRLAAL